LFFLTYAHGRDSRAQPPTNDWRKIKSMEEAKQIARDARARKNPHAVAQGRRSWRKRHQKKNSGTETSTISVRKDRTDIVKDPVRKNRTTRKPEEPNYVYLGVGRRAQRDAPSCRAI
jgi:hypothetical protein